MNKNTLRLLKGFMAFIITLALLYIGQAVWQTYAVSLPLDNALNEIEGVKEVNSGSGKGIGEEIIVSVTLDNVKNLQKTYEEISSKIAQTLKGRKYILKIRDNRSEELERLYYDIHLYIEKSIADGDFPLLEKKLLERADAVKADARVYVDRQNIYLQLSKGGSNLYHVVDRHSAKMGGSY